MTVGLVINQIVCATAAMGVVFASYQSAIVSASHSRPASGEPIYVETPAAQTVNRSAKGDKWKSTPPTDPKGATTPNRPRNPVIIAGQYEVVAAAPVSADPSIAALCSHYAFCRSTALNLNQRQPTDRSRS